MRDKMRGSGRTSQQRFDNAQLAIMDVLQALMGIAPKDKVLAAVGDARSPNAVSRALRHRLSPRYFEILPKI